MPLLVVNSAKKWPNRRRSRDLVLLITDIVLHPRYSNVSDCHIVDCDQGNRNKRSLANGRRQRSPWWRGRPNKDACCLGQSDTAWTDPMSSPDWRASSSVADRSIALEFWPCVQILPNRQILWLSYLPILFVFIIFALQNYIPQISKYTFATISVWI